jgi:hypothetical protein
MLRREFHWRLPEKHFQSSGCWLDDPGSIAGRGSDTSLLPHNVQTGCGPLSFLSVALFPGIKQPNREAGHSHPSSVDVNAWSHTSTSPYILMVWCLIMQRKNFTFAFVKSPFRRKTAVARSRIVSDCWNGSSSPSCVRSFSEYSVRSAGTGSSVSEALCVSLKTTSSSLVTC